jgi:hypothetical protein
MTQEQCRRHLYDVVSNEQNPRFTLAPCDPPQMVSERWNDILRSPDPVRAALECLWLPSRGILPELFTELVRTLRGIGLLQTDASPVSLVYVFESNGEPSFRRGYPSKRIETKEAETLPADFLDLYTIHNGWTDLQGFMGPLPVEEWFYYSYVTDAEWLGGRAELRAREFLVVCNSGGSEYLGFDMSESPPAGLVYSVVDPVEVAPDLVRTLDEWMAVDLRDLT